MYGNITFWSEKNGFVAISSIKDLSDGNQRNEEIVALAEYLFYYNLGIDSELSTKIKIRE